MFHDAQRRKRKKTSLTRALPALALTALLAMPALTFAEATASQKAEFNKLVRERNDLVAQLHRADRDAAAKLKKGDSADLEHARQIAIQDKLDTATMRLESAAVRHGLSIPPAPDRTESENETATDTLNRRTRQTLARGHNRAVGLIRQETQQLLASIDFTDFLAAPAPPAGE